MKHCTKDTCLWRAMGNPHTSGGCVHESYCVSQVGYMPDNSVRGWKKGKWEVAEDNILRSLWPDINGIIKQTTRCYASVYSRAKTLKIYEPAYRRHIWTFEEDDFLSRNRDMKMTDLADKLGVTASVVQHRMDMLGLQ